VADVSLLNRGTEIVTVFAEEVTTDSDGNTLTRPSAVGVLTRAVVQPMPRSLNSEGQEIGYETTSRYRLRLVGYTDLLGAQSAVEWNGKRYGIDGDPLIYNGSRRTAHVDYRIVRK
jgi:hypothetical protein